jgi:hypothetical protein
MGKWNGPPHEQQYLCGAKAKHNGKQCRQFAMKNGRCYYHGGKSTGAKKPHRPIKHGLRTSDSEKINKMVNELIRESKQLIAEITK